MPFRDPRCLTQSVLIRKGDLWKLSCSERALVFDGVLVAGEPFEDILELWQDQIRDLRVEVRGKDTSGFCCHTLPLDMVPLLRVGCWRSYCVGGPIRTGGEGAALSHYLAGGQVDVARHSFI